LPPQNVLEGIGLLMKQGKNHVSWNENPPESAVSRAAETRERSGSDSDGIGSPPRISKVTNSEQYTEMQKHLNKLKEEEKQLDQYLDYLSQQAAVFNGRKPATGSSAAYLPPGLHGNVADQMYVRFKDITAMPTYNQDTVIGIRAPSGTSLEVPDPDQGLTPGQRRFEMYLSSKGTQESQGGENPSGKGEPINVYLVRPRADQERAAGQGHPGGFVPETPPSSQRPPPSVKEEESQKQSSAPPEEQSRPPPPEPHYRQRPGDPHHGHGMPAPPRGGEWGAYHGHNRPPYPTQERRPYQKDHGPPPPGHVPSAHGTSAYGPPAHGPPAHGPPAHYGSYHDPSWGPPPYSGYGPAPARGGPPPPGYYPPTPHRHPQPGSHQPPDSQKHGSRKGDSVEREGERRGSVSLKPRSTPDRAREEYQSSVHFASRPESSHPPRESGRARESGGSRERTASPFRSQVHHFQPPHEQRRTRSPPDEPLQAHSSRDATPAPYHPPTPPGQQQSLLDMPLQSPNGSFGMPSTYFPSPQGFGATGFSPPSAGPPGPRENIRPNMHFPMPPLRDGQGEGDYRGDGGRWRAPPRSQSLQRPSSVKSEEEESPHPNVQPRPRR
jgi:hypothetical protein